MFLKHKPLTSLFLNFNVWSRTEKKISTQIYYIVMCCILGLKCVYSLWLDLTPCSPVCGRGKKVQVRTVAIVKPGTPLEKDCTESLFRNTACNINCRC